MIMDPIQVFVESGKKRTFAGALDWPGWCRSGRDEPTALLALLDYAPRYDRVLRASAIDFPAPSDVTELVVIGRRPGNATTDFGAPAIILDADREPLDQAEYQRLQAVLLACWQAFDGAVQQASGQELQKGSRGGGRDLEKIMQHVNEADRAYLGRLAWKHKGRAEEPLVEQLNQTREAIRAALGAALKGELPKRGPRGGVVWPPRYFVRRVAWHVLDHAWEIEDRVL